MPPCESVSSATVRDDLPQSDASELTDVVLLEYPEQDTLQWDSKLETAKKVKLFCRAFALPPEECPLAGSYVQ